MTVESSQQPSGGPAAIRWLVRVNSEVSQWAASVSWWRLIFLFIVILVAGGIIGDLLHLKHDRVKGSNDRVVISKGPDGIKITQGQREKKIDAKKQSESKPDSDDEEKDQEKEVEEALAAAKAAIKDGTPIQLDIGEDNRPGGRIITAGGILGDVGSVLLVMMFAYLAAAKVVVRKVAQADAKVRTAVDAAEREAMERQLVQAKLQVLQAQVEPHFLFNTLSAVDYLIETEPPRASRMQKALITYLRGALPQMRQESSTLGREMRLIRSYLELIKMRIEDRLEVEIAVPEALEPAEFPPMMLQSLVENAIKHGIEPKPEGGKVRVAAGVQNAQLWVEVSDTGVGVPDGDILDGPTSGTGVGLQNIRERLAMLYPGKSRLMLISDPMTGTTLKISVPYKVGNEKKDGTAPAAGQAA
ncbi:MAG TPA: sensor histidine kinase [Ramlibacter sp.]|nr:sensor histidine kinase [Ramlibacter sp.]